MAKVTTLAPLWWPLMEGPSVNSESIERMARKQLGKSLNAIRVECEVEQIRRHCRRCRKWSRK